MFFSSVAGVNLEAFKLNNLKAANLDTRELIETAINGHSGHSSSEEEQKRELHNGGEWTLLGAYTLFGLKREWNGEHRTRRGK
jgi:hypothetical protein